MTAHAPSNFTEAELLYKYLGERISDGGRSATATELMAEFEEFYQQLQELRASLREAEESSARGESGPLDFEAMMARVKRRWEEEGVAE